MGDAIGFMLPAAVAAALISLPAVMVVILLVSAPAPGNRPLLFAAGWLASFAVTCTIFAVLADAASEDDQQDQSRWGSVLLLALGVALLFLAWRKWQGRPRDGAPAKTPQWMSSLFEMKPARLVSFGAIMGGFNPKYLAVVAAVVAELTLTSVSGLQTALILVLFILIASLGVLIPILSVQILGERSRPALERIRTGLDQYNWVVMMLILGYFGIKIIGDAIANLT